MRKGSLINTFIFLVFGNLLQQILQENSSVEANSLRTTNSPSKPPTNAPTNTPTLTPTTMPTEIKPPPIALIIYSDDFRNELADASSPAILPNLRKLQKQGLTFINAQSSHPVCAPSRNMALTGVRNGNIKTFDQWYKQLGLQSYFEVLKNNAGLFTADNGKVMHQYPQDLPYHLLYATNQTSVPNPIVTAGNTDCPNNEIGCVIDESKSSDTQITIAAAQSLKTCVAKLSAQKVKSCVIGVGYHHSHVEWAAYKKFSYATRKINSVAPQISFDNFQYLLRHLDNRGELVTYRINGNKIFSGPIYSADQLDSHPIIAQEMYDAYMDGLSGVDSEIGNLLGYLGTFKYNGLPLTNNTLIFFTADHGFNMGEQGLWGKVLLTDQSRKIPLVIRWPGITDQHNYPRYTNAQASSEDLFCTFIDLYLGSTFLNNYVHPSGIKPDCVSYKPVLLDPTKQARTWAFSSVYRCENPASEKMLNPCISDNVDGSCDRHPIIYVGHAASAQYGTDICTYVGWWPWHEIRVGCEKPTWYQQPAALAGYGIVSPQIHLGKSGTNFRVPPIQQELLCHAANELYGQGDNPSVNNLINKPAYANFVETAIQQITANNQVRGGAFPYPGPRPN